MCLFYLCLILFHVWWRFYRLLFIEIHNDVNSLFISVDIKNNNFISVYIYLYIRNISAPSNRLFFVEINYTFLYDLVKGPKFIFFAYFLYFSYKNHCFSVWYDFSLYSNTLNHIYACRQKHSKKYIYTLNINGFEFDIWY